MRRAGAALLAALAFGTAPAVARTHTWSWNVQTTPISVKITFYGDEAAGCAAHGVCETYGSAVYLAPKSYGVLTGHSQSRNGRGMLAYGLAVNLKDPAGLTVNAATRGAPSPCTDSSSGLLTLFGINRRRDFVFGSIPAGSFPGFAGSGPFADFLASRCQGPTGTDVRSGLVIKQLPANFPRRTRMTINLDRSSPFSGGGFTGTVTTTGQISLRR